jgi:hypothetical protein
MLEFFPHQKSRSARKRRSSLSALPRNRPSTISDNDTTINSRQTQRHDTTEGLNRRAFFPDPIDTSHVPQRPVFTSGQTSTAGFFSPTASHSFPFTFSGKFLGIRQEHPTRSRSVSRFSIFFCLSLRVLFFFRPQRRFVMLLVKLGLSSFEGDVEEHSQTPSDGAVRYPLSLYYYYYYYLYSIKRSCI